MCDAQNSNNNYVKGLTTSRPSLSSGRSKPARVTSKDSRITSRFGTAGPWQILDDTEKTHQLGKQSPVSYMKGNTYATR